MQKAPVSHEEEQKKVSELHQRLVASRAASSTRTIRVRKLPSLSKPQAIPDQQPNIKIKDERTNHKVQRQRKERPHTPE